LARLLVFLSSSVIIVCMWIRIDYSANHGLRLERHGDLVSDRNKLINWTLGMFGCGRSSGRSTDPGRGNPQFLFDDNLNLEQTLNSRWIPHRNTSCGTKYQFKAWASCTARKSWQRMLNWHAQIKAFERYRFHDAPSQVRARMLPGNSS
jgi:hypothetical protein